MESNDGSDIYTRNGFAYEGTANAIIFLSNRQVQSMTKLNSQLTLQACQI